MTVSELPILADTVISAVKMTVCNDTAWHKPEQQKIRNALQHAGFETFLAYLRFDTGG
jgi:hypothetical protein